MQEDLDDVLELARSALRELLRAEHALVFILDAPRKELWTQFAVPGRAEPLRAR